MTDVDRVKGVPFQVTAETVCEAFRLYPTATCNNFVLLVQVNAIDELVNVELEILFPTVSTAGTEATSEENVALRIVALRIVVVANNDEENKKANIATVIEILLPKDYTSKDVYLRRYTK